MMLARRRIVTLRTKIAVALGAAGMIAGTGHGQDLPSPPPVAAPDPARAAAATTIAAMLIPEGIYSRMMRDQFPALMDAMMTQMMGMSASDLGLEGEEAKQFDAAEAKDPAMAERMRIMTRVMGEEMGPVFAIIEPKVRDGLAASFARRFSATQLADMRVFFASPSGKAFADQFLLTFMDPELMSAMMAAMPEMMKAMPDIMKKVEAATAHLPPPPMPIGEHTAPSEGGEQAE